MALPVRALPTAVVLLALSSAPAMAADTTVRVGDDFFDPETIQIDPGNTVTWEWVGLMGNHSVTSRPGQTESFDSDPGNDNPRHAPGSAPFVRQFNQVGVNRYFCKLHPVTMTGTVTVGTPPPDTTPPSLGDLGTRVGRRRVKVSFDLSEAATVSLTLAPRGGTRPPPSRRIRRRLEAGRRAILLRRGAPGRYRVTLTAEDEAGNKSAPSVTSFRLRRPRR